MKLLQLKWRKLERWGNIKLLRPDQIIWPSKETYLMKMD